MRREAPAQAAPRKLAAIDWERWSPRDRCTLLFVVRDGQILLIRKKRGLGTGKVNGPGGRLEPGESPAQGAARELQEELGVSPLGTAQYGELSFQFVDGYSTHVVVFRADGFTGELRETEEAVPLLTPLHAIPYSEMWEDDRIWLPALLKRQCFRGRFLFEGDVLLDGAFWLLDAPPSS